MKSDPFIKNNKHASLSEGKAILIFICFISILSSFGFVQVNYFSFMEVLLTDPCTGDLDENAYPAGDFGISQNNIEALLLLPAYIYTENAPPSDGAYTITNFTGDWDIQTLGNWKTMGDNSNDPNGNFLLINLREEPHVFYVDQIEVCPGVPYQFSMDIMNVLFPEHADWARLAEVDVLINDQLIYSLGEIPQDTTWHKHTFQFIVSGADQAQISFRNNSYTGLGGDLALDNISINRCHPNLNILQENTICENASAEIYAELPSDFIDYSIRWQSSTIQGAWNDIPGANEDSLYIENADPSIKYRYLIAEDVIQINTTCALLSNDHVIDVMPFPERVIEVSIQEGESYNGIFYTSSAMLQDTLETDGVCDSLIITNIEVRPDFYTSQRVTLCEGDEFLDRNIYNNTVLSDTLISSIESDSFILYDIRINPSDTTALRSTTCEISEQGIYEHLLKNRFDCDSLIIEVVVFNGGPDTILMETFTCNPSLEESQEEVLTNAAGCDSVIIHKSIFRPLTISAETSSSTCAYSKDGEINQLAVEGGTPPYEYAINGSAFSTEETIADLAPGVYNLQTRDSEFCMAEMEIEVPSPEPLFLNLGPDIVLKEGTRGSFDFITNAASIDLIAWSPLEGLSCSQCKRPQVSSQSSRNYIATIYDENGCSTSDTVFVQVEASYVYIPSAFSPNADGFNDHFSVFANERVEEVLSMEIFDRWGQKVYDKKNFPTGFMQLGWDGTFRYKKMPLGIYIYKIELLLKDGSRELRKGELTLMR